MGNDWIAETGKNIAAAFEVDLQRAIWIPELVQEIVHHRDFDQVLACNKTDESFAEVFMDKNLIESLKTQAGPTVESRWNSLVKEHGIADIIGREILLLDPSDSTVGLDDTLLSNDTDAISLREGLYTARTRGLSIEYVDDGLRVGDTVYRPRGEVLGDEQRQQLAQYQRWKEATGLVVDSDLHYAMHDSLYSNPEQANAYDEASELGVDGLAYAIWKLGWDDQVDGWVSDEELGWQPENTIQAIREYDAQASGQGQEAEETESELTLSSFEQQGDETAEGSDEGPWVYYWGPDGDTGWQDMSTPEEIRYQAKRPGPAPEGGDGYGDYLPGWHEPPEDTSKLSEGQLLEVQLGDRNPEITVVTTATDAEVTLQTESLDSRSTDDDSLTILAAEDSTARDRVAVPEWTKSHRNS